MTEIILLKFLLFGAFIFAPLMTSTFYLKDSKLYLEAHKISILILLFGAFVDFSYVALVWPIFCAFGFFLYLKNEYKYIASVSGIAHSIPLIFSVISSVWFVAGVLDLHLLGYNQIWSFYAALHGSFLGWMFVGGLAFLSKANTSDKTETDNKNRRHNKYYFYLIGCYLSLIFFLFVAFGINGVPYLKRIGLIGFSVLAPISVGHYLYNLKKEQRRSLILSLSSLIGIILSMALAITNEFWSGISRLEYGIQVMVLTHGLLNSVFTVPCYILAIWLECKQDKPPNEMTDNIIFFDDLCILCSRSVGFLIKIDKQKKLKFTSLAGKFAQKIGDLISVDSDQSVIFWSQDIIYYKAEAVIQILIKVGGLYRVAAFTFTIIPLFILNFLYDLVARNRYRIFGKNEVCLVPSRELKDRFIS